MINHLVWLLLSLLFQLYHHLNFLMIVDYNLIQPNPKKGNLINNFYMTIYSSRIWRRFYLNIQFKIQTKRSWLTINANFILIVFSDISYCYYLRFLLLLFCFFYYSFSFAFCPYGLLSIRIRARLFVKSIFHFIIIIHWIRLVIHWSITNGLFFSMFYVQFSLVVITIVDEEN